MSDNYHYLAIAGILAEVKSELDFAVGKFPEFNGAHEGYAIILEELDELWDEIKNNKAVGSNARQRKEAIQVATMAIRFVLDISNRGKASNERKSEA